MAYEQVREFLIENGFTENKHSFEKGDMSLMKTRIPIWLEVVYKHEIIRQITAIPEKIKEVYKELTQENLIINP